MSVSEANDASGRTGFDREVERLALLEDPVRRALYRHVVRQGDYVSRDDAATALGIARGLAAFHLDKLAQEDLLEFIYRRPNGRTGPGAGRPAKLYRRSRQEVAISLPHRDYRLLADLLAAALGPAAPEAVRERFVEGAHRSGAELAADARRLAGRRPSRRRLVEVGLEVLRRQGFDPYACGGEVTLRNCPFEAVARAHPALVCPMNRALVEGFVEALNVRGMSVTCEPGRAVCCVALRFDS